MITAMEGKKFFFFFPFVCDCDILMSLYHSFCYEYIYSLEQINLTLSHEWLSVCVWCVSSLTKKKEWGGGGPVDGPKVAGWILGQAR